MNSAAQAWVNRAETHFATAHREWAQTEDRNPAVVVYCAHMCTQAYLRARLLQGNVEYPHTPHLVVLLYLCLDLEPAWESFRDHLRMLTSHDEATRDATQEVPPERVEECMNACTEFRSEARKAMGI